MTRMTETFNAVVAVMGTFCTYLFGGWDMALNTLIILMRVDYITGILKGYVSKRLSSVKGRKGLLKKISILFVLIVAVALDRMLETEDCMFRTLVCFFYISNEGISIIENSAALGVPIPDSIKNALEQLKGKK